MLTAVMGKHGRDLPQPIQEITAMTTIWFLLFTVTCNPQYDKCKHGNGGHYRTISECRDAGRIQRSMELISEWACIRKFGDPL